MSFSDLLGERTLHEASAHAATQMVVGYTHTEIRNGLKGAAARLRDVEIPDAKLMAGLREDHRNQRQRTLPTTFECAVHLALLEAHRQLMIKVNKSHKLILVFGLGRVVGYSPSIQILQLVSKWGCYWALSVTRFQAWREALLRRRVFCLPPLDVLMVWCAYLLHPTLFVNDEEMHSLSFWTAGLPWSRIDKALDRRSNEYKLTKDDELAFEALTGHPFNLAASLSELRQLSISSLRILVTDLLGDVESLDIVVSPEASEKDALERLKSGDVAGLPTAEAKLMKAKISYDSSQRIPTTSTLVDQRHSFHHFIAAMSHKIWLRSPALVQTIERGTQRYTSWLKLCKMYPNEELAPAADVEFIWHTHQCSPSRYRYVREMLAGSGAMDPCSLYKKKVPPGVLQQTERLYRIHFIEEYFVCLCWDCEEVRSVAQSQEESAADPHWAATAVQAAVKRHRDAELARRVKGLLKIIEAEKEAANSVEK